METKCIEIVASMNTRWARNIFLTILLLAIRCIGRPFKRECGRVFHFDFENRRSRGGIWQGREGRVKIYKGKAIFQGAGSLIYPFFSQNDLRGGFAFSFKIKPASRASGVKVAILSNGWEPGTSTLTVFHNDTCLGVRLTEANNQRVRNIELVVPQFKMHTIGAIRTRQQLVGWGIPQPASGTLSRTLSQNFAGNGDTPAEGTRDISKSRDDRDVKSNKNGDKSISNEQNDKIKSEDNRGYNSSKLSDDYVAWDYLKYSYGNERVDDAATVASTAWNSDSGEANVTQTNVVGSSDFESQISQKTTPQTTSKPLLTRTTRDTDSDSSDFVEIRKIYKVDPHLFKDRYRSKTQEYILQEMETLQRNSTGEESSINDPQPSSVETEKYNVDLDEIEVRLSQDGSFIRFQVGTSPIQQTPVAPTEHMKAPNSALRIGSGGGLQPFIGTFDDFVWYTCTPDNFFHVKR